MYPRLLSIYQEMMTGNDERAVAVADGDCD